MSKFRSKSTCVLSSGGMDSYLAWVTAVQYIEPFTQNVFVNIDQKYVDRERRALQRIAALNPEFTFIEAKGPPIGAMELPSGIIPNRNAELILAASTVGFSDIMLGVLHGEINTDKGEDFMRSMQTMLDLVWAEQYWNDTARYHRIFSPIRHWTKSALVADYIASGGATAPLLATLSCYAAGEDDVHCGACPSCFKRWVALVNNNLHDQEWRRNPREWSELPAIISKCYDGTYDEHRANEILSAINAA